MSANSPTLAIAIAIAAGIAIAVQGPMNAALGQRIGGTIAAAAVAYGVGFVTLTLAAVTLGQSGSFIRLAAAPSWLALAGVMGAFYIWAVLWTIPTLGVLTALAVTILGQLCAALVLDATGAFGLPQTAISISRISAVILVGAGVVMSRI